jgi:hypothetical protein
MLTDGRFLIRHATALAILVGTWLREEEARAREQGMDQTSYRLVIDAGHNEGTSLREEAGYDEKC